MKKPVMLPCPFCEYEIVYGEDSDHLFHEDEDRRVHVMCPSCWAMGPCGGTRAVAVLCWNAALREVPNVIR